MRSKDLPVYTPLLQLWDYRDLFPWPAFMWTAGRWIQSSCLFGKYFIHWATCLAPWFFILEFLLPILHCSLQIFPTKRSSVLAALAPPSLFFFFFGRHGWFHIYGSFLLDSPWWDCNQTSRMPACRSTVIFCVLKGQLQLSSLVPKTLFPTCEKRCSIQAGRRSSAWHSEFCLCN